jgi:hypothetical protein
LRYYDAALRGQFTCGWNDDAFLCFGENPVELGLDGRWPTLVLIRPIVRRGLDKVADVLQSACRELGVRIVAKNIGSETAQSFCSSHQGFRFYEETEYWHKAAKFDDQTYPEVVIELGKGLPVAARGPVINVTRAGGCADARHLRRVFQDWISWFQSRHAVWERVQMKRYYDMFISPNRLARYDFSFLYWFQDRPCGYACGDWVADRQVDMWVCFCSFTPAELSRAIFLDFFEKCRNAGAQYVNLGGSEEEGLHEFKVKLAPHALLERTHVICEPTTGSSCGPTSA